MLSLYKNLYQFSQFIQPMNFTIHSYLLATEPAILFATGTHEQSQIILPQVKEILGECKLKYIVVSHIESDECGGIEIFKSAFPDVIVICSTLAAREFSGFGYSKETIIGSTKNKLKDGELSLLFIDYPSEIHLQNGIIVYDENSGILYSSDLFLSFGNGIRKTIQSNWHKEIESISTERVPSITALAKLQLELSQISPAFIAVGHGFCVDCMS